MGGSTDIDAMYNAEDNTAFVSPKYVITYLIQAL